MINNVQDDEPIIKKLIFSFVLNYTLELLKMNNGNMIRVIYK